MSRVSRVSRVSRWTTTRIGSWDYPPGVAGYAIRAVVVLTLVKAALAVPAGLVLLVLVLTGRV